MTLPDYFALAGAILVAGVATPQFLLVVRTKDTHGLATLTWILNMAIAIGWASHGIKIPEIHMIWPNSWALIVAGTVLYFLHRNGVLTSWLPVIGGLGMAGVFIGFDYVFGTTAYGLAIVVPQGYAMVRQGIELMRAPEVTGVSTLAWVLQVLTQATWLTWAIMTSEWGSMIAAGVSLVTASFVLTFRVLRGLGMGPVGARGQPRLVKEDSRN
ncbi:MAG: hypothetical protein FWG15_04115 [Propionibacteriaceae bacterium]|nr:hypothetical protein [Propionibacteriaceae bacterium]